MRPPKAHVLIEALGAIAKGRVLVVGDAMLDSYILGSASRLSPEAPVAVLNQADTRDTLGGAANVAANITALGGTSHLLTTIGRDGAGERFLALCATTGLSTDAVHRSDTRRTTLKTRIVAGRQQLLRIDDETPVLPTSVEAETILETARSLLPSCDAVILSDYGKGLLAGNLAARVIEAAASQGRPVLVDPKGTDWERYRGATLVTPNQKELSEAIGRSLQGDAEIISAARTLMARHDLRSIVATRGADGMTMVTPDKAMTMQTVAREVFDVSGAGDTVIAVLGSASAARLALETMLGLANAAAGVVVGKLGTAVAHPAEVRAAIDSNGSVGTAGKRLGWDDLIGQVSLWRRNGLQVGFTNGCFDLLHPGHISLLEQARAACDRLVVGLNTDSSVRRLKGDSRPVQDERARARVLGALAAVDAVVLFDEDTPQALIETVSPDVLVKGADYTRETVVGADFVEARGGRVVLANLVDGHSTSALIDRAQSDA